MGVVQDDSLREGDFAGGETFHASSTPGKREVREVRWTC